MSALYLSMLRECGIDKGQTIAIAVCKCIGTRTPTICGTPEGNRFIPVTDGICFVWDVIYIVELKKVGKREKARTAGPHSVRHFPDSARAFLFSVPSRLGEISLDG